MEAKDWTGQKFGKITLLKRSDKKENRTFLWEGICECGVEKLFIPNKLASGHIISCGCGCKIRHNSKSKNWTDQKFFRITLLKKSDKRASGQISNRRTSKRN